MRLSPGERLGSYEIVSLIGSGGMGEVYRARDTRLRREVALKLLATTFSDEAVAMARFQREGHAIAALSHPNICAIYDVGMHGEIPFLVMEYLQGETVAARLRRGPFTVSETIEIGSQVADALAAVHRSDLIHRDLNPTNIMLTATGAKLLDFGLAKINTNALLAATATTQTELSAAGMLMGTLAYMSPEQLQGVAIDHRADLFALGAVLYEMLTARRAFEGVGNADVIAAVLRSDPQPVKNVRPEIPHSLAAVVKACLHKEPEHRWQHAADVGMVLRTMIREPMRRPVTEGRSHRQQTSKSIRSLVVLPFSNATNDANQQYLADGMTESLIASMSVIARLKVISRASAMRYPATDKPIPQVANELNVHGVIRGSVRVPANGLEVRVALFDGTSGECIWDKVYERPLTDLVRVQGEIAETIAA
jgi:serine/threonine protein kinase